MQPGNKDLLNRPGAALVVALGLGLLTVLTIKYTVPAIVAADLQQLFLILLACAGVVLATWEGQKKINV